MDLCINLEDLVQLTDDVRNLGVHLAYTASWLEWPMVPKEYALEEEVFRLMEYIKSKYTLNGLKSDKAVRAYRDFYWKIGIDPTKTRPSSEALVRRILRGEFPRINPVVDAGNIASAYTMVPIGMYDLDRITPPLALKLSAGGEPFKPLGGHEEILVPGYPVLVDGKGLIVHVYPHRDSSETCVTSTTKKVLVVAAGVPRVEKELLIEAVKTVVRLMEKLAWRSCEKVEYKA
ncbi:MAG: phenylalanine--tRNA ligase beta subunit-related protein [Desulfurococcaceae archaeon]